MSKMFDYISGRAAGREAELEATLEHVMAHCVPEPEYDKLREALELIAKLDPHESDLLEAQNYARSALAK